MVRIQSLLLSLPLLAASVAAFPSGGCPVLNLPRDADPAAELEAAVKKTVEAIKLAKEKRQVGDVVPGVSYTFNAAAQYISTTGEHKFVPPTASDLRGPCPGLNALANHGYLPHNGYASLTQYIDAVNSVYGMAPDLGGFISTIGVTNNGDLVPPGFSMGGIPSDSQVPLSVVSNLLSGRGKGLNNAHGTYEGDASIVRGDFYQFKGDAYSLQMRYFNDLYALQQGVPNPNFDYLTMMKHKDRRITQCIAENPYFFSGTFSGLIAPSAAYFFTARLMANHSTQNPDGLLTPEILKTFFAVTGNPGSFKWTPGWDRIPDNWYRRPDGYGLTSVFTDIIKMWVLYPNTFRLGGNQGRVNSFAGVGLADLTGGVYTETNILQGDNLQCFIYQALGQFNIGTAKGGVLGAVGGVLVPPGQANNPLSLLLGSLVADLACPQISKFNASLFSQFPAYRDPTAHN